MRTFSRFDHPQIRRVAFDKTRHFSFTIPAAMEFAL